MMGRGWWLGVGLAGVAALALGATDTGSNALRAGGRLAAGALARVFPSVLAHVSGNEGSYDSLNLNSDGAGLSWGLLQWAQARGGLGRLLARMYQRDPGRFERIFGPAWRELLQVTATPSLAPAAGAVLWSEPWVSRFRVAGRDPVFREVQLEAARSDTYWPAAVAAATSLGVVTQRALVMTFDTAVQQGPETAKSIARKVASSFQAGGVTAADVLSAYALQAAAPYRRTTAPTKPHPSSPRLRWAQVGNEWHVFAGAVDLYVDIRRRRGRIAGDPNLSDAPLPVG